MRPRTIVLIALLTILLAEQIVAQTPRKLSYAVATDLDYDGLDDAFEQQVLESHSPYIWMARGDDRLPCDYLWFVQHSSLQYDTRPTFKRITLYDEDSLSAQLELTLNAKVQGRTSDFLTYRGLPRVQDGVGIYLNLNNAYYNGQPKTEVLARRNVGMLGHVAALTVAEQEYVCVQYWQFFALSDADYGGWWNHEGDWNMYEQFIRVSDGVVVMAVWYVHGNKSVEHIPGINPEKFRQKKEGDDAHLVSFIPSQDTVYVGYKDHEFYRDRLDHLFLGGAPPDPVLHYQTTNIPNIGEILLPMPGHKIICRYNASWGTNGWETSKNPSPEGIMHNTGVEWQWPVETQIWVDKEFKPVDNAPPYPLGSAGSPFQSLGDAATAINNGAHLSVGQRLILVRPGSSYSEAITIDKPCRIVGVMP